MPDVAPLIGQAEGAGNDRLNEGLGLLSSPQGSGPGASSDPVAGVDRILGAGGNFWDWDSGLAVGELPNEPSDAGYTGGA
jgi:hypothetical protein